MLQVVLLVAHPCPLACRLYRSTSLGAQDSKRARKSIQGQRSACRSTAGASLQAQYTGDISSLCGENEPDHPEMAEKTPLSGDLV